MLKILKSIQNQLVSKAIAKGANEREVCPLIILDELTVPSEIVAEKLAKK